MKQNKAQREYRYVRRRPMDDVRVLRLVRVRPAPSRKKSPHASSFMKAVSSLFLVLALILFGGRVGYTVSYFNDTDSSSGNVLGATSLDFSILPDGSVDAYIGAEEGGGKALIPVMSPVLGSSGLEYRVFAEKTGGSDAFCSAINATATTSPFIYSGPLISLVTATTTTTGSWPLALSLAGNPPGVVQGDICMIDLVYRGWSTFASEGAGYQDEERVHLILHARMVVINEFLPIPEGVAFGFDFGTDASTKPQGEWVEFFNNSTTTIDLAGWYVWDASSLSGNKVPVTALNTLPATTLVPPQGFLVVYLNAEILDNTSDEVRLYNSSDVLVDAFAYDSHDACIHEPTPDLPNDPISSGGVCDTVPPNKSYARIPDGLGARLDPIPTPGFANTDDPALAESSHEFLVPVADEPLASTTPEALTETSPIVEEIASTTTATSSPEVLIPAVSEGGGGGGGGGGGNSGTSGTGTTEEPAITEETETETAPETSTKSSPAATSTETPAVVPEETPAVVSEETPAETDADADESTTSAVASGETPAEADESATTEPTAETPAPEATTPEPAPEPAPSADETPTSPIPENEAQSVSEATVPEATPAPAEVPADPVPAAEPEPAPAPASPEPTPPPSE